METLTGCLVGGVNGCEYHLIDRVSVIEVECDEHSMIHCAPVHVLPMVRTKRETFDRMPQPEIDVTDVALFQIQ